MIMNLTELFDTWKANDRVRALFPTITEMTKVKTSGNNFKATIIVADTPFEFHVRNIFDFGSVINPHDGGTIDCGGKVNAWDSEKGDSYTKRIMSDEEFAALLYLVNATYFNFQK